MRFAREAARVGVVMIGVWASGCAHRAAVAPPPGAPEPAPPLDERALAAVANDEVHPSVLDAASGRPRIREVVTLGNSDPEPLYPSRTPGVGASVAAPVHVTVINQVPSYGWGYGYGGFASRGWGYRTGYGTRTYGFSRSGSANSVTAPGSIAGANWNTAPNYAPSPRGVPTQVGGDWGAVRDYGPRPMR